MSTSETAPALTLRERKTLAMRKWTEKNKDRLNAARRARTPEEKAKVAAQLRAWHAAHPEAATEYNRRYYKKTAEDRKAYGKAYYAANKERIAATNKAWRAANKDAQYAKRQERRRTQPERIMLNCCRKAAKAQDIPFNLEPGDIVVPTHCPALGFPLTITEGGRTDSSPSVDRIIPKLGYVKGNIVVVSWRANRIKNDSTPAELARLAVFYTSLLDAGTPTE